MAIQSTSVEEISRELVNSLVTDAPNRNRRYVIGLAGIPGSGKTTLAQTLKERVRELWHMQRSILNAPWNRVEDPVCVVSLDGWHLTRAELRKLPDPDLAFQKRGAPWTFDDVSYAVFVEHLLSPGGHAEIPYPLFDHKLKDPTPRGGVISAFPEHPIVIIEGLYSLLGPEAGGAWHLASDLLDERWFIQADRAAAKQRLVKRHLEAGICESATEAVFRVEDNDMPNGDYLTKHNHAPSLVYLGEKDKLY